MPSEIGMIAEKYVMRAPLKYSGTAGPGTFVTVQLATGACWPMPIAVSASNRAESASVAAGACLVMSVSSLAPTACSMSSAFDGVLVDRAQPPHRVVDLGAERHAHHAECRPAPPPPGSALRIDNGAIDTMLGPGNSSCVIR
jgi:hypothetical protein